MPQIQKDLFHMSIWERAPKKVRKGGHPLKKLVLSGHFYYRKHLESGNIFATKKSLSAPFFAFHSMRKCVYITGWKQSCDWIRVETTLLPLEQGLQ